MSVLREMVNGGPKPVPWMWECSRRVEKTLCFSSFGDWHDANDNIEVLLFKGNLEGVQDVNHFTDLACAYTITMILADARSVS